MTRREFRIAISAWLHPPDSKSSLRHNRAPGQEIQGGFASKETRYKHPMTDRFRIALAQLNPLMGDIAGNLRKARSARAQAASAGADLILFTELFIVGYPPEDLVLKPALQDDAREAVERLAADTADGGPAALIGTPGCMTRSSTMPARCSTKAAWQP